MADEKVRYVLDVDDKGSPKLVKFGDTAQKAGKKAEKSFEKAGKAVSDFGEQIPGVSSAMQSLAAGPAVAAGTAITALGVGFGAMIKKQIDFADGMNDLSLRLGISTERLSVLSLYAQQSGTDIESLATAMGKLGVKISEGDKNLKRWGITAGTADEALFQLADRIAGTEDPMLRLKIATDAFGKSGQQMLPLLVQGGDALREMAGNAPIVSTELAQMADNLNDRFAELNGQMMSIGLGIAEHIIPEIDKWLDGVDKIRRAMGLLNKTEQKEAERNAVIAKFADKQAANRAGGMAGAPAWLIEKTGANRIDGKTLSQALAEIDKNFELPPSSKRAGVSGTGAAQTRAGGRAVEVDFQAIDEEWQKQHGGLMGVSVDAEKALGPDYYANIPLSEKAMASLQAQSDKADAIAAASIAKQQDQIASVAQSASSVLADSFMQISDGVDAFGESIVNGFASMLSRMAAELAANAALVGFLSLINPGAAASFAGGLGGLSGLVLGRATGGSVDGGAVIYNERREEAIIQRGPARVEPVASGGDTFIFQVQNPAQASTLQRELQAERRLGKRGIRR